MAEFPKFEFPRLMLMITGKVVPDASSDMMTWLVAQPHPFVEDMTIVAMYANGDFVEVYSVNGQRTSGIRELIPMRQTRLLQERMPMDVFIDELAHSELGDDDDDPDDDPELPDEPPEAEVASPPANGQVAP